MSREMKDSGVEWIGNVPKEWALRRLQFILKERNEKNIDHKTNNILSLTASKGVIPYSERESGGNKHKDDITSYKIIRPNDIVINSMNVLAGSVGLSKYFGCSSPVYYMLYSENKFNDIRYYNYIFQSTAFQKSLRGLGNGIMIHESENGKLNTIRMRIPMEKLNKLLMPLPPLSEQQKIADFLDEKVKEIDKAIEKTKETIELYKSFANSMLTELVTGKNLESPKVKHDSMNYLGEVPKSWKTTKLKTIFRFVSVKNHPNSEVLSLYRDYGVIPKSSRDDNHNVTSLDLDSYKFVKKGNLVVNKMKAWQGSLAVSNYEGIVSPAYHVFEFKTNDVNKKYINYLIRSKQYAKEFERLSTGMRIGQWDLSKDDFLNTSIVIPDMETQQAIVEVIEKNMNDILILINKKNKLIDDLENYKQSLIYEYVTGKKEVE